MTHTNTTAAIPSGSIIASNPPGPRPSQFKVLGNSHRGFQVWLSRDGMSWIPYGESHPTCEELAIAFAESCPRPAEIHDPIVAAAYTAKPGPQP